jgi:hypothetical protein
MKSWTQCITVAGLGLGLMSGVVHAQGAEDFLTEEQLAEPAPLLARDTSDDFTVQSFDGRSVLPVKVRNCWYFVYSASPPPSASPNLYWMSSLVVERLPIGGCQPQARVLAKTHDTSTLLAVTHAGDELVIAYSIRLDIKDYQDPTSVKLFHVSTDTLENQRPINNELSLERTGYRGRVYVSHLEFVGQDLVVHGHKTSPITSGTPEEGSGPYFKATFDNFLRGTTPPSILASGSPTTELGAEELRAIEAHQLDPVAYESPFTAAYASFMPPFRVRNCWYVMHQRWSFLFSPNRLYVDRLPVNGCSAGRLFLDRMAGMSNEPRVLVAVRQGQLALAWTTAASLYSPYADLQLAHVDARTLTSVRSANTRLSTRTNIDGWYSKVTPEQLSFDGHRLVVQGTKTGPVREVQESGSGSNFTATFEHFLSSDAPPSVVAY